MAFPRARRQGPQGAIRENNPAVLEADSSQRRKTGLYLPPYTLLHWPVNFGDLNFLAVRPKVLGDSYNLRASFVEKPLKNKQEVLE